MENVPIDGCQEPTLIYEDLKCKPIFTSPNDCCPFRYDCSHIEKRSKSKDKTCHFHGKTYNIGESIDNSQIYKNCKTGCYCKEKSAHDVTFNCAVLDCPEWLGKLAKPGCHLTYELDKCCSVGELCPPFIAKCEIDGKVYYRGQRFSPKKPKCINCVCQEGFQRKYVEPFCKKHECIEEVTYQKEIEAFCAPSYISKDDCCPYSWICPKDDKIIPGKVLSKHSGLKCKFGEHTLNIGDGFSRTSRNDGKLTCECRIPPYLTCVQDYKYSSLDH